MKFTNMIRIITHVKDPSQNHRVKPTHRRKPLTCNYVFRVNRDIDIL
jgi:hypothetical protein